ncbi:WD40-repeat-containing domain protein [Mariannaea sp. PMI_226]|nr:WD40-repeat-containing domain protein [Mariannaea sp. PMI_226]
MLESSPRIGLSLRFSRVCSKAEITSVGISPSTSAAFAIYKAEQASQSWIDVFDVKTQRGYSKTSGSQAVFSPQGNSIATVRDWTVQLTGGVDIHHSSSILIRDATTGKTSSELKAVTGETIAWSKDGRVLAVGEERNRVGVWDTRTSKRIGRVMSHFDTITHAAFMPDNSLVTASRDGTLRITNPATAKTLRRLEIEGSSIPRALAISLGGHRIVSIWGTTVHVWMPYSNDLTSYNLNSVRAKEGWPLCISPDGRYLVCRTEDGFDIMSMASGEVVFERDSDTFVTAGEFSLDGNILILGKMDGTVDVWDVIEKRG